MEISISRDVLVKPLGQVAGVVERRQTLPILAYVLIRLNEGRLTMAGTDLEVEVLAATDLDGGSPGEMTVPARKLLDICRSLPAEATVKISQKGEKAVVSSGRSRFTLVTMPSADFPGVEASEWTDEFEIPQGTLKSLLEATQFCMAHQDVRYYLNGLLLEVENETLRAVATDGHRMGMREVKLAQGPAGTRQVIVPRKGVLELSRFLDESDTPVKVSLGANHIRVVLPDLTFTSKLIDGRFPDYSKVIPQDQTKRIVLERQDLRNALSRAAILSNEKYRGVRLTLENQALRITAHNPEQEEAEEEVPIDYSGESLEIGFNVTYLIEAMGTLTSEQVQIGLSDPNSSCTLTAPGDDATLYVIMPMRL
jgi:DNA polymerase-3 subunit beta